MCVLQGLVTWMATFFLPFGISFSIKMALAPIPTVIGCLKSSMIFPGLPMGRGAWGSFAVISCSC